MSEDGEHKLRDWAEKEETGVMNKIMNVFVVPGLCVLVFAAVTGMWVFGGLLLADIRDSIRGLTSVVYDMRGTVQVLQSNDQRNKDDISSNRSAIADIQQRLKR